MARFHQVKLEIVRPGPAHNQFLSPLTPYMALCGEGSPLTFHVDYEHHTLLSRLERLRYDAAHRDGTARMPDRVREAAVAEVGEEMAGVLAQIRPLLAEVARARSAAHAGPDTDRVQVVHLRLVLGGSELSLLPFELALAPQAMPGEGLEFCLQLDLPVVVTRETRCNRPLPHAWNGKVAPRILVVAAAPTGFEIPLDEHVRALVKALEPWVDSPDEPPLTCSLAPVKRHLRVLPNADIDAIYDLCARESFTHVHVLAHGTHLDVGGVRRFGLVLCRPGDPTQPEVVSAKRLAKALQAESRDGSQRSRPLVVTLLSCDSGAVGSVLVPGGSMAHELQTEGIPWVFASQFPLTKPGSVHLTEALYPRLLRGDDPRQALFEVRRLLYLRARYDHDWTSLVAYATLPDDFDDQVMDFFGQQARRAIEVGLARAERARDARDRRAMLADVERQLSQWQARLPQGRDNKARESWAECYGMQGSTYKRIALLHEPGDPLMRETLQRALGCYRKAIEQWATDREKHHWVTTQALSLSAILDEAPDPATYALVLNLARRDLDSPEREKRAWAHGSMAELEMLGLHHLPEKKPEEIEGLVRDHCRKIVELMGEHSFHVQSTRRQFERYRDYWPSDKWNSIAQAALAELAPPPSGGTSAPDDR